MTTQAMIFMAASWIGVLSLVSWTYRRILTNKRHFDPDGIGPAQPPAPPLTERN